MSLRIAFMGTPAFAVPVLEALLAAGHRVVRVYTRAPRPAGRGQAPRRSAVHEAAHAAGLLADTPASFRDAATVARFRALAPEVAVVAAYGQILPQAVLDVPAMGCLNVHASLLPRWRGAAPIQRAIMSGDAETGVSIMQMEAGLDTGPVLVAEATPIGDDDTAATVHDRLARLGARLVVRALEARFEPVPQPAEGVTYAAKIDKGEARIAWGRSAAALSAHVRGLSPFPGAWFEHDGERIKVLMARAGAGAGSPGRVLDERLTVACGDGALRLVTLQRQGRQPLPAEEFLRGYPLPPATMLG